MFYMTAYFVLAYGVVALLLLRATLRRQCSKGRGSGADARFTRLTVALILLPLVPYAVVALQTAVMLHWLQPGLTRAIAADFGKPTHPRIVRVLRVFPSPVVYAVLPCTGMVEHGEVGALYTFRRSHGGWEWDGVPDCAWSDCGSADGNTFPPYPEAREF